jgi:hypothetical protein
MAVTSRYRLMTGYDACRVQKPADAAGVGSGSAVGRDGLGWDRRADVEGDGDVVVALAVAVVGVQREHLSGLLIPPDEHDVLEDIPKPK